VPVRAVSEHEEVNVAAIGTFVGEFFLQVVVQSTEDNVWIDSKTVRNGRNIDRDLDFRAALW